MSLESGIYQQNLELIHSLSTSRVALGHDFLAWAWFVAETAGQLEVALPERRREVLELWLDERMTLASGEPQMTTITQRGGTPQFSKELAWALAGGKSVQEARLGLRVDGVFEVIFSLKAKDLCPTSVKFHKQLQEGHQQAEHEVQAKDQLVEERLAELERFYQLFEALFTAFLELRSSDEWLTKHRKSINDWISKRVQQGGPGASARS